MRCSRKWLHLGSVTVIAACLAFAGEPLAAQGAQARRIEHTATTAPDAEQLTQPARSVLRRLVGRWHFAVWFAGNLDGPPDASGTRVVEQLYDSLRIQWTDQHGAST